MLVLYVYLEKEVGSAVPVDGVALVAVVLLLGVGAAPHHEAGLLPCPCCRAQRQSTVSEAQLELAAREGLQERSVGEIVMVLDMVDDLGAQQGFLTQETLYRNRKNENTTVADFTVALTFSLIFSPVVAMTSTLRSK